MTQYDKKKTGGWVQQVQGEHYQRKVLRVWVKVIGPVGNHS